MTLSSPSHRLVVSHTHLDQYDPAELPAILERARRANVTSILVAGVTAESSERCVRLAEEHEGYLWAGVGVHPMELEGPLDDATLARLRELAGRPEVVCISEVGLDYMPDRPARSVQEQAFRAQLRIAIDLGLPVIYHNREAGLEPLRILQEEVGAKISVVAHYFQGPREYAFACLDQGVYLSLGKPLLRLPDLQEIVRRDVPLDRIILETDSYPQPFKRHRERWTEPWQLPQVAAKVAELKGISLDEVAEATTQTLERALGRSLTTVS